MLKFIAGAAAFAMTASLAYADPAFAQGNGNGNGNGNGKDNGAAQSGGKPDKARGKSDKGEKQSRDSKRKVEEFSQRDRGNGKVATSADRSDFSNKAENRAKDRSKDYRSGKEGKTRDVDAVRVNRREFRDWSYERDARDWYDTRRSYAGFADGCPPGLAKKNNGCLPPGQAKKLYNDYDRGDRFGPSYFGLRGLNDGRYFLNDGYLLRLGGGDRISGFIPLLGGALSIGNPWPQDYYSDARLPPYYENYFNLGRRDSYRYADDVIYRVDPQTAAITSIAAILTGDEFVVGQGMPRGYDVYNVPYSYRDQYYDTPERQYRYADGYVYQVDPQTQLIAAAIDLLI